MTYRINGHAVAPGVVVEGTMDTEVLLRALADEHHRYRSVVPEYVVLAECWLEGDTVSMADHYSQDEYTWDEVGQDLVNTLMDNLNSLAPRGLRFGNHEGDGACWGWWETGEDDDA